jgi:ketosteroid isomerase-like protein
MADGSSPEDVAIVMRRINEAWLSGRTHDLAPLVHADIVMQFPGFAGRIQGREEFIAGFEDFRNDAVVHEFLDRDRQVDVAGNTAVVTFRYEMLYERSGKRHRATGRDLWVFQRQGDAWIAVWRTMFDLAEVEAGLSAVPAQVRPNLH